MELSTGIYESLIYEALKSLHLINDNHVGLETSENFDIIASRVVRHDLEQLWCIVLLTPLQMSALYDVGFLVGEMLYLLFH